MKDKDLLNILGDIDEDLVEDAAPGTQKAKKTIRGYGWIKYVSVVACCAIIVCGAIIAKPLYEKMIAPYVVGGEVADSTGGAENPEGSGIEDERFDSDYGGGNDIEQDGMHNNEFDYSEGQPDDADDNDENVAPEESSGDVGYPEPDYAFVITISDESYDKYDITGYFCDPERVGEKIDEITVKVGYGFEVNYVRTEIYKVLGVDSELALCIRYIHDGEDNYVNDYLYFDVYYFLLPKSYSFDSLDGMRSVILDGELLYVGEYHTYYNNICEEEITGFTLKDDSLSGLKKLLLEVDGEAIGLEGGANLEQVRNGAEEIIGFGCTFEGDLGYIGGRVNVYDNGYLYFGAFGGQLFAISEESANDIIDFILKNSKSEEYVWNEEEGKWDPIVKDNNAEYDRFLLALEENKLYGELTFETNVDYWQNSSIYPSSIYLNPRLLAAMTEVIYCSDGMAVKVEDIYTLANESVSFKYVDGYGSSLIIRVYDNGYIHLFDTYYDMGIDFSDKILYNVKTDGVPIGNFYWDKTEDCWHLTDESNEKEEETDPEDSVDYGYGEDIFENDEDTSI